MPRSKFNLDILGMILSLACAIHCALVPVVLMFGALTGLHFLANPAIEHTVIMGSMLVAAGSLIPHYFHHRRKEVLIVATTGFALIFVGHAFGFAWLHAVLMTTGGIAIAISHLLNWKYCKAIKTCNA